jgi:WD40 repeat protein
MSMSCRSTTFRRHWIGLLLLAALGLTAAPPASRERWSLPAHKGWVGAVAFAPGGPYIFTGGADRKVRIISRVGWPPLTGHTDAVSALAFSPRGGFLGEGFLATGSFDGTARLWVYSVGEKKPRGGVFEPFLGAVRHRHTLGGHRGVVMTVAFAPAGKVLATGGMDATIRLWDAATGKQKHVLKEHRSWVNGLAFSEDGKLLASASSDATVKLWNVSTRKVRASLPGKDGEVRCVAVSPDGKLVAGGLRYGRVRVWDTKTGKEVAAFPAHAGETWSVAFAPNGKTLVSGGGDWKQPGEVRLWDARTWKQKGELKHSGEVLCVAVSPEGWYIAAGAWDGNVKLWYVADLLGAER